MRHVIVCTEHKGVFFGRTADMTDQWTDTNKIALKDARMAIYWGTTKGVVQLAETGPTASSKISSKADMVLTKITCVMDVSPAALEAWSKIQ